MQLLLSHICFTLSAGAWNSLMKCYLIPSSSLKNITGDTIDAKNFLQSEGVSYGIDILHANSRSNPQQKIILHSFITCLYQTGHIGRLLDEINSTLVCIMEELTVSLSDATLESTVRFKFCEKFGRFPVLLDILHSESNLSSSRHVQSQRNALSLSIVMFLPLFVYYYSLIEIDISGECFSDNQKFSTSNLLLTGEAVITELSLILCGRSIPFHIIHFAIVSVWLPMTSDEFDVPLQTKLTADPADQEFVAVLKNVPLSACVAKLCELHKLCKQSIQCFVLRIVQKIFKLNGASLSVLFGKYYAKLARRWMNSFHQSSRQCAASLFSTLLPILSVHQLSASGNSDNSKELSVQNSLLILGAATDDAIGSPQVGFWKLKGWSLLRDYQKEGVQWLNFLRKNGFHGVLADEMGLGKTAQTIVAIEAAIIQRREVNFDAVSEGSQHKQRDSIRPILIVCPPSLTVHWSVEILRFASYLKPIAITFLSTSKRKEALQDWKTFLLSDPAVPVFICSYGCILSETEILSQVHFYYIVLDEGHVIRNADTKLAKSIKLLESDHRIILTGTPIQNYVMDIWSLFDFLMPGYLGNKKQYRRKYGDLLRWAKSQSNSLSLQENGEETPDNLNAHHSDYGDGNEKSEEAKSSVMFGSSLPSAPLRELRVLIYPFILRRLKSKVLLELPKKIIQDVYCELHPIQERIYAALRNGNLGSANVTFTEKRPVYQTDFTKASPKHEQKKRRLEPRSDSPSQSENNLIPQRVSYCKSHCTPPQGRGLFSFEEGFKVESSTLMNEDTAYWDGNVSETDLRSCEAATSSAGDSRFESKGASHGAINHFHLHGLLQRLVSCPEDAVMRLGRPRFDHQTKKSDLNGGTKKEKEKKEKEDSNVKIWQSEAFQALFNQSLEEIAKLTSEQVVLPLYPKLLCLNEVLKAGGMNTGGKSNGVLENKFVIFTQHKYTTRSITTHLLDREYSDNRGYLVLDGTVPAMKRGDIVHRFNTDPSISVIIVSTRVGGLGLSLTAGNIVIFVEHDWNPMVDLQAMDRSHRIGQSRTVHVIRLLCRNTVEEEVMGIQEFKRKVAAELLRDSDSWAEKQEEAMLDEVFDISTSYNES